MSKLVLRPLEPSDGEKLYRWLNDDEINNNALFRDSLPISAFSLKQKLESGYYCNENRKYFMVVVETTDIGLITLTEIDYTKRTAKCDFLIAEHDFRNQGYAVGAVKKICSYFFDVLSFRKLYLGAYEYNRPSIVLQAWAGARYEGTLRQSFYRFGKYWDKVLFAIDEDLWRKYKAS